MAGKLGVVARLDSATTTMGPDTTEYRLLSSVEEASAFGAEGVTTIDRSSQFGFINSEHNRN